MNLNEQLKSILGSQIMCINIYTSLAKSQVNFFITESNARLDFSLPLILTYIWQEITFVWNPIHFGFLCIHINTHIQTCTTCVHVCIHIGILMARSFRSRENVFLILSASLSNFIALSHSRLSLERGVYIKLTSKYVKSRTIVKQKPKINKKQSTKPI